MRLYLYQLPPKELTKAQTNSADNNYKLEDYVLVNAYNSKSDDTHEALEEMFEKFNDCYGYNHRSMSVSDIVEVSHDDELDEGMVLSHNKFYWCDHIGFTEIEW